VRRRALLLAALSSSTLFAACASAARLSDARFMLLGEVHDHAEQHRERAALLRELLADRRATWVVFEQMDRAHDASLAAAPRDAERVADAGALDRRAWGWPLHRPLFEAALDGGATVRGGNLPRDAVRAVVRDGRAALPADVRGLLDADTAWGDAQQRALEREIADGHCGMLPASQLGPMALAQRARDAAMARALLDAPAGTRAVLIAGNGHVRTDLGVPRYLRAAGVPARQIVAIGFIERGSDAGVPYDERRESAPLQRPDPCAALRR
jgi:uncharacterized iron-regulated protein